MMRVFECYRASGDGHAMGCAAVSFPAKSLRLIEIVHEQGWAVGTQRKDGILRARPLRSGWCVSGSLFLCRCFFGK